MSPDGGGGDLDEGDDGLAERLATVRDGVRRALDDAGRTHDDIVTVVVTKFQPVGLLRRLHALGVRDFGESRHQEARSKSEELAGLAPTWHFVGRLQSKKAKQATAYARVIHSLDRDSLVDALLPSGDGPDAASAPSTDVFVQLNLSDDLGRGGAPESELERLTERVLEVPTLRLLGVMAVAPLGEPPRSAFSRLREAAERMRRIAPDARLISAGMSGDYREAILEGATHLRIGTAITGLRPTAG